MTPPAITPLDHWIGRRIGLPGRIPLNRDALVRYQIEALNRTLHHARRNSPFYRRHLAGLSRESLAGLDRLADLPFTAAAAICRDPLAFLCVSRDRIARTVTLQSSGTTGPPKRFFFTDTDLEQTIDFFHHGMSTLVEPGQRVLILMPGDRPASVGDLLVRGLFRMGVVGIVHGPVYDPAAAIRAAREFAVDCLVGIPVQVLAMATHECGPALAGQIRTILLSTDYVPDAIVGRIERAWGCRVFKHYGMTEMGLGGGVECAMQDGYHLREADLLVEVVDPASGRPQPAGRSGEIVVTTLTREGMPLIRYRTGDVASFRTAPCRCGTGLKTLGTVRGRKNGRIAVGSGDAFTIGELDEALFGIEAIDDYAVQMDAVASADRLILQIRHRAGQPFEPLRRRAEQILSQVPAIRKAVQDGCLRIDVRPADEPAAVSTGSGKRRINDQRERTQNS